MHTRTQQTNLGCLIGLRKQYKAREITVTSMILPITVGKTKSKGLSPNNMPRYTRVLSSWIHIMGAPLIPKLTFPASGELWSMAAIVATALSTNCLTKLLGGERKFERERKSRSKIKLCPSKRATAYRKGRLLRLCAAFGGQIQFVILGQLYSSQFYL